VRLAKPRLDLGLFTNQPDALLPFWQNEVGLPFEELLPVGGGVRQYRHGLNGSVLKINAARDPLPDEPRAGFRELLIARAALGEPRALRDPDGNRLRLVPPGYADVTAIGIVIAVRDLAASADFYQRVMQFERAGDSLFRCGDTLLLLEEDPAATADASLRGCGYRYMTVQVFNDEAEHRGLLQRGAHEGRPPIVLGSTARISFVRDPDGNWIEISQRASLTGTLNAS
jgi:catechol 2,3-dioxygenase-like lactoylglutathione lyase family enzyme